MSGSLIRSATVLGLLAAVGPLAIDMYLPALPAIEADLGGSVATTQMTLTAFFIAFGLSQLVYGPWSDQSGRRLPLLVGLAIFTVGSLGCALAPDISWLIAFRFLQGLGAAVVMVIPRAIIRDMHTGYLATKLMALVMLVISVSPMLAPLVGTGIIAVSSWRGIFFVLSAAALLSVAMTLFALEETLPKDQRVPARPRVLLGGMRILFTDPLFLGLTFIGGFGMASFFVFIASASFVYTGQYGLTLLQFSLAFAFNALGFFAASQTAAGLGQRFGVTRVVSLAVLGFALATMTLAVLVGLGFDSLALVIGMLFVSNACLGLVIPTTMVLALDHHGAIAGLASSLGGTLQMITGGVMIAAASPFFDGTVFPMVVTIATCGLAAVLLMLLVRSVGTPQADADTV